MGAIGWEQIVIVILHTHGQVVDKPVLFDGNVVGSNGRQRQRRNAAAVGREDKPRGKGKGKGKDKGKGKGRVERDEMRWHARLLGDHSWLRSIGWVNEHSSLRAGCYSGGAGRSNLEEPRRQGMTGHDRA